MKINVFIECEAGSDKKNVFNEETLEHKESFTVSRQYPLPYGFIQGTKSGDSACLDCFILTTSKPKVGETLEVEVIGAVEQFETRNDITKEDHNILAQTLEDAVDLTDDLKQVLADFISHVWDHREGKKVTVGKVLDKASAEQLVENLSVGQF